MYQGEEPPHPHHLPKMEDDDDDDHDDDGYDHIPQGHPYPANNNPGLGHNQPFATPQQPLQPPKPLFSPNTSRPPSKRRSPPSATPPQPPPMSMPPPPQQQQQQPPPVSLPPPQQPLQPPQPIASSHPPPTSPPPKPGRGPPPDDYDDDDNRRRHLCAVITVILLLVGLTALILWLLYRPAKPRYTAIAAAVYTLNTTSTAPPFITASLQFTILTRNPSKRTSLHYDRLVAMVQYRNHPITQPAVLPPLHQVKRSAIMMSPVIGGGAAVGVPPELVEGLAADKAYGVVGLSWVLVGRVRYKVGWLKSGHYRVYVRCDVMVGFKNEAGQLINPNNAQMPLLGNPPCFVDI